MRRIFGVLASSRKQQRGDRMTEWKIFECDRCGKELKHDVTRNTRPHKLSIFDAGLEVNRSDYDLCEDCYFLIVDVLGKDYKEYDKLADKLALKKTGE
jgi:hypothetical protein